MLLAVGLLALLLSCAAAWRITHQPQPVPADHAGWNDIWVDAVLTAVALGGPFDGASWQLSLDQLPAPQQVWLPASGGGHRYRLDARQLTSAPTPSATVTYTQHPVAALKRGGAG